MNASGMRPHALRRNETDLSGRGRVRASHVVALIRNTGPY